MEQSNINRAKGQGQTPAANYAAERMLPKKKVLIVDDEAGLTALLKLNLELTGQYEVRTENAPADVAAAAEEFQPDLIFLDVMMPTMDGGQLAAMLQANPRLKSTRIVFLTAAATKAEVRAGGGMIGGMPFLAKPVSRE